jgi:hypothetical protein
MQFTIPAFGSAESSRLTIPLTQGQANFEEYLKGYSTIANRPTGSSVAAHVYAQTKLSYKTYNDEVHGVFDANKSDIPTDACQTAQSVWTSDNVTDHKSRKLQHSDILEIKGAHPNSESLSIILKSPTQICGRTVWQTAIPEMVVLYLSKHDSPLNKQPIHQDELDQ